MFFSDLNKLASIAYDEYRVGKNKSRPYSSSFSISVQCVDRSSYESGDLALLREDSPIRGKRITKMDISAYGPDGDEQRWRIRIEIGHGDYRGAGVLIEGRESIWVNGVMSKFNDLILAFAPQSTFVKRHWNLLCIFGALGIGCITYNIFGAVMRFVVQPSLEPESWRFRLFMQGIMSICGLSFSMPLVAKLSTLWPTIELATGPEHAQIERKRRVWLLNFTLLAIIPLIVNIVYDLFKAFVK